MSLLIDVCKALQPVEKKYERVRGTDVTPADYASRMLYYEYYSPPANFDILLQQYTANPWVYAAVYLIANTAASVPFKLMTRRSNLQVDENYWLWHLLVQPNPWMSFIDLLENTFLILELVGNAFWELVYNDLGTVSEIYFLDPSGMRIVPDAQRFIRNYVYVVGDKEIVYEPKEIVHFKYANPTNEYWGLGCLQPVWTQLGLDYAANEYNAKFFANDATPGGVITTSRILSDTVYNRLVQKWDERHRGKKNAFQVAILEDGMDFKQIATTPQEAAFPEMRKAVRDALFVGMGVPPVLAGVPDVANYSTARVAQAIFYDSTIAPKLRKVENTIDTQVIQRCDRAVKGVFDTSTAPVNVIKLSANSRIVARLSQANLMTLNEARALLGLPPVEGGDIFPGKKLPKGDEDEQEPLKVPEIEWKPGSGADAGSAASGESEEGD